MGDKIASSSSLFVMFIVGYYVCYCIASSCAFKQSPFLVHAITHPHLDGIYRIVPLKALSSTNMKQPLHGTRSSHAMFIRGNEIYTKNIDVAWRFGWGSKAEATVLRDIMSLCLLCGLALFGGLRTGKQASHTSMASAAASKVPFQQLGYYSVASDWDGTLTIEDNYISEGSFIEHTAELSNKENGAAMELLKFKTDGPQLTVQDRQASTHIAAFAASGEKEDYEDRQASTHIAAFAASGEKEDYEPFLESPFTLSKVVITMALWCATQALFCPILLLVASRFLGVPLASASNFGAAKLSAAFLAANTLGTFASYTIFSWRLASYQPFPPGWFVYDHRRPLGRRGWLTWAAVGIALAILATIIPAILQILWIKLLQPELSPLIEMLHSMIAQPRPNSMPVYLKLSIITSVLTPLMEERVFRGFLLPSLTKWMPVGGAIVVSSACFAAAHSRAESFMFYFLSGNVLGFIYIKTKNLLAPTLVHCLYHLFAFSAVMAVMLPFGLA